MTTEIMKLEKMRAGAREKVLTSNPELRKAWEEFKKEILGAEKHDTEKMIVADADKKFTFCCSECGNVFKAYGKYARCSCGEDTHGMVHLI